MGACPGREDRGGQALSLALKKSLPCARCQSHDPSTYLLKWKDHRVQVTKSCFV